MAKLKISDYSSTSAGANLNTDINSINIDEGCAPSGINNAIRTLMAQLKDFQTGVTGDSLTLGGALSGTSATFSGDLTVDTNTLYVDSTNNEVGIGTTNPLDALHVEGTIRGNVSDASDENIRLTTTGGGGFVVDVDDATVENPTWSIRTFASEPLAFDVGGTEKMRIDENGDVGIGTASPSTYGGRLNVTDGTTGGETTLVVSNNNINQFIRIGINADVAQIAYDQADALVFGVANDSTVAGLTTEHMRITSGGSVGIACTTSPTDASSGTGGLFFNAGGRLDVAANDLAVISANRIATDGGVILIRQNGTTEGNISVSGSTVSYNGGHLARFAQLPNSTKDESILKGTVLSNLNDMCVYVNKDTGETADNEQLNKVKVSDVEGDPNVAGVHVAWIYDEQHDVEEINMAMTGDMIIRIAQGVTVNRGDLLMSAGDGTAKPQGDDIVRSKTIAKVTSTSVTCTYDDGSYCVPCVLMAC